MSSDTTPSVCGIDLGTTNSCIAVIKDGQPSVVPIQGRLTMPSVVAYRQGQWLVGEAARNHLWVAPNEAVASIKRKMDDPQYQVAVGDQRLSPIEVSAKILQALVQAAQQEFNCVLNKAVITVPAWFKETQRQATLLAGQQAGLEVVQIINEPTAAAIAHQQVPIAEGVEEKWLVYDLGGGTFDVSVLNVTDAAYEVLASQGNTYLGGDDFDHRLADKFVTYLRDQHNVDPGVDNIALTRLRLLAEQTKMRLSSETQVRLNEPVVIGADSYLLELTLTRDDFEQWIDDLVSSTLDKAEQALNEAGVVASSLHRLLLVGGSTRIPLIRERLVQRFGLEPESWLDPDLAVALGASVRGAIVQGTVFQRSVVDICPHSLGIAAVGEEDYALGHDQHADTHQGHPRTFVPLIRRNSRLPAKFVRRFYKAHDKQQHALIPVYQGEQPNTRQNTFIGEFYVDFSDRQNDQLDISFAYDLNGTINIAVTEVGQLQAQRHYTMNLSLCADENSESRDFIEQVLEQDGGAQEDSAEVTNYLIEKVSQRLQAQGESAPEQIKTLLQRYRVLLDQDQDQDKALDEVEDQLYDWIDSE